MSIRENSPTGSGTDPRPVLERENPPAPDPPVSRGRQILLYVLVVGLSVALILAGLWSGVRHYGGHGTHTTGGVRTTAADTFAHLLLALPVVLLLCHLMSRLFQRMAQPGVIGEICVGILLGPSLLGLSWPTGYHWLLPESLNGSINVLAQLGLIFFMFLVGYELDLRQVRGRGRIVLMISHVGIAVPMLSGVLLALVGYSSLAPHDVGFVPFALFFAVSMSITAFPVLARILIDRRMERTRLGALALACAAVGDVTAWCLLTVVVATTGHSSGFGVARTLLSTLVFSAVMWGVIRPALARLEGAGREQPRRLSDAAVLPALLAAIMLAALATDRIGIHAIFGAFLLGVIVPRGSVTVEVASARMRDLTVTLLLPLFFVYSGLRTEFGLFGSDPRLWSWCLTITAVAVIGKWGSTVAAARGLGIPGGEALALGTLMNCRGLTELIVLNVGLDLKVITPTLFTMFVTMALVSTVMTSPVLTLIDRLANSRRNRKDDNDPQRGDRGRRHGGLDDRHLPEADLQG
ncbi:potassium transporter [Embleya hyalina]|uniref:Potassium transporter n=1 Tax=Embleya hyalina TaxID=516124 RepID=A0A401Z670_9ACTN|nr:potassium transporter [Embleya hyalina]